LKIRTKILFGFLAVVLIAVAIGVAGCVTTTMLTSISEEMQALQAEGASISNVLNAHYLWRQGLTEAVLNGSGFTGSLDSGTCSLGQWYGSPEANSMDDPELLRLLESIDGPHRQIHADAGAVVAYISAGNPERAKEYLNASILPHTEQVISVLTEMQARYSVLTAAKNVEAGNIKGMVTAVNWSLVAAAVIGGVSFALFIANMVSKPLAPLTAFMKQAGATGNIALTPEDIKIIGSYGKRKDEIGQTIAATAAFIVRVGEVSKTLETIADGDLSVELAPLSDKDALGVSLQKMTANLGDMFVEINAATERVSIGSRQIAEGAQSLAQGSTQQAATVQQLAASASEIHAKTQANAELAESAADMAGLIMKSADKGSLRMNEMVLAVGEISRAGESIGKVMKAIDDIAFQTNILALNAAVEAARAGQHGKGFAVVAEEVRNLAAKSAEAARDTGALIQNSIEKAQLGAMIAKETAESLEEIVAGIGKSGQIVARIAESSQAQAGGIANINNGITLVAQVVQQNSATAEQSAAASQEMSSQAHVLHEMVARFRLKQESEATSGHYPDRPVASNRTDFSLSA
jgi:methyl-accepting chemotaxis protein